uniref:CSON014235 protein n=1 Tax=Culicoides sonorensis TaxID=179676 RepID=A0A336ME18_CULSO
MSNHHSIDDVITQVRAKLQQDGVKLWEPPYYIEPESQDDELEELGRTYSLLLGISAPMCIAAVKELQSNALEKIAAKARFNATGIASLKIRIPNQPGGTLLHSFDIKLTENGKALQEMISSKIEIPYNRIKLIFSGRVIDPSKALIEQRVTNNQQLLALVLPASDDIQLENDIYDRVAKIKADAEILIKNRNSEYMVMEDQQGNPVYLPESERNALMLGLALHEKGRVLLNRENYTEALVLFLEADNEFSTCHSKLLESVDNYALLNLDIVWCYLCLKSVTQLPDAERRLKLCEDNFRKSYGENFDRVIGLKGSDGNEKALIMRLHLLQAILYYHQNRRAEAQGILSLAESELLCLKVDESALTNLIEMGYSLTEARIGLRARGNNIESAINFIMEQRERRKEARKKAKEEQKLLSRGFRGGTINPNTLKQLIEMGFDKDLASVALEQTENDVARAVNLLQEDTENLRKKLKKRRKIDVEQNLLDNLVSIGFDTNMARMALKKTENNLDSSSSSTFDQAKELIQTKRDEAEAFQRFREDYNNDEDEYLDLPLIQEETLILEYKKALNMM